MHIFTDFAMDSSLNVKQFTRRRKNRRVQIAFRIMDWNIQPIIPSLSLPHIRQQLQENIILSYNTADDNFINTKLNC